MYNIEEKIKLIKEEIIKSQGKNPILIAKEMMNHDFVNIHGPEHHFLDGASFLMAYKNSGGDIDITKALQILEKRSLMMPGAMCGFWGICGSVSSMGAVLSIIHETGPLSDDDNYSLHMKYTSSVIEKMSLIGGPRCCKRNAFLSLTYGVRFVKEYYGINLEIEDVKCEFSKKNQDCILDGCPFHNK